MDACGALCPRGGGTHFKRQLHSTGERHRYALFWLGSAASQPAKPPSIRPTIGAGKDKITRCVVRKGISLGSYPSQLSWCGWLRGYAEVEWDLIKSENGFESNVNFFYLTIYGKIIKILMLFWGIMIISCQSRTIRAMWAWGSIFFVGQAWCILLSM